MRILFVCNEYPPSPHGGIGTFVKDLAQHLVACGQEVIVVGYDPTVTNTQWRIEDNVSVLRIASPYRRWPQINIGRYRLGMDVFLERWHLSRTVQKVCYEKGIDIVESYDWSGPLWSKPLNVPLVVRLHGANTVHAYYEGRRVSRLLRYLEQRNVRMADALVAVSRHIGDVTLEALGLNGRMFRVIYNGVDTQLFSPQPVDRDIAEVLYVGSLHRRKGIRELLSAWSLVLSKCPQAHLSIVGRVPDGPNGVALVNELLSFVPEKLRRSVNFVGYVDHGQLPLWYSRAAVAVFPSHAEAFGLTCAEAMACGAAVVMTKRGSGPELVEDGISGLLVDPSDIQSIAGAINRLLQDSGLRCELGSRARQRVQQLFDSRMLADRNLEFYAETIREYHAH